MIQHHAVCDPTLLATETNRKKHFLVLNFYWFYLVTSNEDAYGKCKEVNMFSLANAAK